MAGVIVADRVVSDAICIRDCLGLRSIQQHGYDKSVVRVYSRGNADRNSSRESRYSASSLYKSVIFVSCVEGVYLVEYISKPSWASHSTRIMDTTTIDSHVNHTHTFNMALEWTSFIYVILTFIAALIGCVLTFVLMSSFKYRSRSYSVYFRFMVLLDLLSLFLFGIMDVDDWLKAIKNEDDFIFRRHSEVCLTLVHLVIVTNLSSLWILVAMTIDCHISVAYPHLRQTWNTKSRAVIISVVTILVSFVLVFVVLLSNIVNIIAAFDEGFCVWEGTRFTFAFQIFIDVIVGLVLPIPLVLGLSIKIVRACNNMTEFSESRPSTNESNIEHVKRSAYCLAIIALVTVVLTLPIIIVDIAEIIVLEGQFNFNSTALDTAWQSVNLIRFMNHCCKFYVLVATDITYRQDLLRIYRSCFSRGPSNRGVDEAE